MKSLRQIVSTEEDAYDKKLSQIYKTEAKDEEEWFIWKYIHIYYIFYKIAFSVINDKENL